MVIVAEATRRFGWDARSARRTWRGEHREIGFCGVDACEARPRAAAVTAEGIVGAVFSVLHARLLERDDRPFVELLNPLMGMIGAALSRAGDRQERACPSAAKNGYALRPARALSLTTSISASPIARCVSSVRLPRSRGSHREVADQAGISDQGQISKLLARLAKLGLAHNSGDGHAKASATPGRSPRKAPRCSVDRCAGAHAQRFGTLLR